MPGKASLAVLLLVIGLAGLALNYLSVRPGTRQLGGLQLTSLTSLPAIFTLTSLPSSLPTLPSSLPTLPSLPSLPHLYLVTPTYTREEQEAELTRLAQTLLHVPSLTWLVVEDSPRVTPRLVAILDRYPGIHKVVLAASMPQQYRRAKGMKPRGVANRNLGIKWVLEHGQDDGVLYFADDDNTYDLRLFRELRLTRTVGIFPVGLVTRTRLSSPIVKEGRIVGFFTGWKTDRLFEVDMAGFAVRVSILREAASKLGQLLMPFSPGYEEDGFLRQLGVPPRSAQPLAANCTQVLVWHTKTLPSRFPASGLLSSTNKKKFQNSNIPSLLASI